MNPWGFHRMWGLGSHFRKKRPEGIFPVPVVDWGGGFKWLVVNLVTWGRSKDCWEVLGTQLVDLTKIIKSINWHNTQGFPCIRWSSSVIVFDQPSYVELPVSSYNQCRYQYYPRISKGLHGWTKKRDQESVAQLAAPGRICVFCATSVT